MPMRQDSRDTEDHVRRVVLGVANLLLAAMLVYAVLRFQSTVARVYGDRYFYVPVAMIGLAVWRAVVGLHHLLGRRRGA